MKEPDWLKFLQKELPLDGLEVHTGGAKDNKILPAPNCDTMMQYGDMRIETRKRTIVIEVECESSGGIHNFIKYLSYLSGQTRTRPRKDFVLVHVYGGSFPSHKALWYFFHGRLPSFVVDTKFYLIDNGENKKEKIVEMISSLL